MNVLLKNYVEIQGHTDVQTITANNDIHGKTDLIIKDSKGEEVTRTEVTRPECYCEGCNNG